MEGYKKACEKNAPNSSQIFVADNVLPQKDIGDAVQKALETCDCIITNDDLMCLRVINLLNRKNISVPNDIRLASMYSSYLLGISVPSITRIDHKSQNMGESAAKMLINILEDEFFPKSGNKITTTYEIIAGDSAPI